jgi:HD-like signal output (HDOD) protein
MKTLNGLPAHVGSRRSLSLTVEARTLGFWDWFLGAMLGDDRRQGGATVHGLSSHGATNECATAGVATMDPPRSGAASDAWWHLDGATLTEPAPIERPELSTEARALENVLLAHFDSHDLKLPPMPRVAEKVTRRLSDRNFDIDKLADDLSEDQVIAAAVLRMANSALYGGREKITSLSRASNRLGANAIRTLMMHQSLRAAAFGRQGGDPELAELIWNRSIAAGCVMRGLSQFTSMDAEEAFLVGLLHDIGNVIVLREVQKQEKILRYKIGVDAFEYLCFECHQEFGELVADAWRLPELLKALISDHHTTPTADTPYRNERLQVQLCDMILSLIGFAPEAPYDIMRSTLVAELELADNPDFHDFLIDLPGFVELHVVSLSF